MPSTSRLRAAVADHTQRHGQAGQLAHLPLISTCKPEEILMKRKNLVKNVWGIGLTLLLLLGCSPQATLTQTPVPPTPTSIPPTSEAPMPIEVTPTPKPVEVTPTPRPVPTLGEQPSAVFGGPIEISGKASSGAISFAVSEDRSSVTSVSVTLKDVKCDGMSAGSMETTTSGPFPVTDGKLAASPSNLGEITGQFTSSTEAVGTIHLRLEFSVLGQTTVCELGTWNWSAEAG